MKITFYFILLVICYIIYSTYAVSDESMKLKNTKFPRQSINPFNRPRRPLSNLLRIPGIICYYAKFGRWPTYDPRFKQLVLQFSVNVFALSDEAIKLYCTQVFQFNRFFRPVASAPREGPTILSVTQTTTSRLPTTSFQNFFTTQSTSRTVPTLPPTIRFLPTLPSTTTVRPMLPTTTTTTQAPTGSASGTGTGKFYFIVFMNLILSQTFKGTGTATGSSSGKFINLRDQFFFIFYFQIKVRLAELALAQEQENQVVWFKFHLIR